MKILFSVGNFGFLRNFEPALRLSYPERIRFSYAPSRKDAVARRFVDAIEQQAAQPEPAP